MRHLEIISEHQASQRAEEMTYTEKEIAEKTGSGIELINRLSDRGLIHSPIVIDSVRHHHEENLRLITLAKIRLEKMRHMDIDQVTALDMVRSDVIRDVLNNQHTEGTQGKTLSWREPLLQGWMFLQNENSKTSLAEAMLCLVSSDIKRIDLVDIIKAKKLLFMGFCPLFVYRDDSLHVRTTVSFNSSEKEPSVSGIFTVQPAIRYFDAISERLGVAHPRPYQAPDFLSITKTDIGLIESAHVTDGDSLLTLNLGAA